METAQFFDSVRDFGTSKHQLIFMNQRAIINWVIQNDEIINVISTNVNPDTIDPYYYRNILIHDGELMLLQNTEYGDLYSALKVSKEWEITRTNPGYRPRYIKVPGDPSFEVYTLDGMTHRSDKNPSKTEPLLKIFGYKDGRYAAALFLNTNNI